MEPMSEPAASTGPTGTSARQPHRIFQRLRALTVVLSEDFLGGPKVLKMAWVINFQKGATLPFVLLLMWAYQEFSVAAWAYAGLHGSYGLIWLLKDRTMPDPNWEKRVTFGGAFMSFAAVLGPYWIAPFLLISNVLGPDRPDPPALRIGIAILVYAVGLVLMMASDAQKYFTLQVRRGLITTGLFARIRHPNYLGEMMIYGSFALLVGHWLPWLVLVFVWFSVFATNIAHKEASMSRYPEWEAYRRRSGLLLPRFGA